MIQTNKTKLANINWYAAAYLSIVLLSLFIRVFELDSRSIHYDEAIHLMASFKLTQEGLYQHSAWMHGPLQIESVSAIFHLLGDSLFTGRILYVIVGTGLVCLPLLLRSNIGKPTTLIMAILLTVSPTLVYMSRFARNDIIIVFLSLLLFILSYKYVVSGKLKFLFMIAATLALLFSTKETSYFIAATLVAMLTTGLIWIFISNPQYVKNIGPSIKLRGNIWNLSVLIISLLLPLSTALTGFLQGFIGITIVAPEGTNNTLTGTLVSGNPWINVQDLIYNPVFVIIPAIILSVFASVMIIYSNAGTIKKSASIFILLIFVSYAYIHSALGSIHSSLMISIVAAISLVYVSILLSPHIQHKHMKLILIYCGALIGLHHILITSGHLFIPFLAQLIFPGTSVFNEFMTVSSLITLTIITTFYIISVSIGIYKFSYKWILIFGLFTSIILITYTTYFTNSQGFYTGVWQSLGYWMAQQEVARGNQPWYYYIVGLTTYEFLPLIFGITGIIWAVKKKHIIGIFLGFWVVSSLIFFTVASEKMPWLLTYLSVPLILISSLYIGSLFHNINALSHNLSEKFLLAVCSGVILLIILAVIVVELNLLMILTLLMIVLTLLFISATIMRDLRPKHYIPAITIPIVLILFILTTMNTYFLNFNNDDSLKQFMIYAQGSHNLSKYFDDTAKSSLTTIDYDVWYPMHWYARHQDINKTVNFRCFKTHGDPEWNETCLTLNDINNRQNFLISENNHTLYQSQASAKNIIGPQRNIIWFPEIYRRPGENRMNETQFEQLELDYQYFRGSLFNQEFWKSTLDYLFLRDTDQDWFHGDYYIYEQIP